MEFIRAFNEVFAVTLGIRAVGNCSATEAMATGTREGTMCNMRGSAKLLGTVARLRRC